MSQPQCRRDAGASPRGPVATATKRAPTAPEAVDVRKDDAESKCIAHGRHWELQRYEWHGDRASFAYVHRFTGRRVELERSQPRYAVRGRRG